MKLVNSFYIGVLYVICFKHIVKEPRRRRIKQKLHPITNLYTVENHGSRKISLVSVNIKDVHKTEGHSSRNVSL